MGKIMKATADAYNFMACNKHIGNATYEEMRIMMALIEISMDRGESEE